MQFSQIWGEVGANFPTSAQPRVKMAVNAAYHEWLGSRQWSYRESSSAAVALVASQQTYTLLGTTPVITDFDGLIDVVMELTTGSDRKALTEMRQQDFDRVFGHVVTNGEPAVYCVRGGTPGSTSAAIVQGGQQQLALAPPPLATAAHGQQLIIRYFRSAASVEMVADTDVPILPAQYHYALVVGGNAYMAEALGNAQKAAMWRQTFQQRVQEAITEDEGLRMRDAQLLEFKRGPMVYPITGQSPATFSPESRPYDDRS